MGGKERRWRTVGDTAELSARRERTVEDGERRCGVKLIYGATELRRQETVGDGRRR